MKIKFKYTFFIIMFNSISMIILNTFNYDNYDLIDFGGLYVGFDYEWYKLITHSFIHSNIDHYIKNIMILFMLSIILENKITELEYLLTLVVISLVGGLCIYNYGELNTVVIGSSGLIHGFTILLFILYVFNNINLNSVVSIIISMYLFYLIIGNILYYDKVSLEGHLGGFIGGLFMSIIILNKSYDIETYEDFISNMTNWRK